MDRRAPVFATLGCRLNAYETEAMKELAAAHGVEDAVVVNTCAVTSESVRKARQEIRRLRRENPNAKVKPDTHRSIECANDVTRSGRGNEAGSSPKSN